MTLRHIEFLDRQAKSLRAAAAAEQSAAERLNLEGKVASAWSAAACAMEFRRQTTEVEQQIEDEQAELDERLDLLAGEAANALASLALDSNCSIEDAIEAVRATAEREFVTGLAIQAERDERDRQHFEQAEAVR